MSISNNSNVTVDRITQLGNLPFLNITSPISNIPHLTNSDIDLNMPFDNNFNYYSIDDFHSNHDITQCAIDTKSFSALNCNIRSLTANYDNLLHMFSELNFPFSLIGLSEIKFKVDKEPLTNINIQGYSFISQPSLSNAGGVAFYIKNNLKFGIRLEFTTSNHDFETLWIEIHLNGQQNSICGIIS
jgi:hypothetical protein